MADRQGGDDEVSNGQRALFTFLGYALVGPLFAGVGVLAALILAPPLQLGALIPQGVGNPGHAAIATFVWAAIPAALAGVALAAVVWRRGTFPWITAVAAGGIAFMLGAIVMPPPANLALTPLTVSACFIAIAVRAALVGGGIIKS